MKTILIVEDNQAIRTELLGVLGLEGYEALGAENGDAGILLAQQYQPDLIISDITMPGLDGYEMIAALRQNLQTAHIPVVFMTGESEPTIIQQGLQLGAVGFLTKPCPLKDILATITKHVGS